MKVHNARLSKRNAAQSIVEFALAMPVLLLVIFVVIEVAHIIVVFNTVGMASREASRFAAGMMTQMGDNSPHWKDCKGIRAAVKRVAVFPGIADSDIHISYDTGPHTTSNAVCNPNPLTAVEKGGRITVQVTAYYSPLVPIIQVTPIPITSSSSHTILTGIPVGTVNY